MSWLAVRSDAGRIPIANDSVNCCVTSPPYYGLRDYGVAGQIGLEPTHSAYVARLVEVFREVRRVLRDDGTLWLNLGDTYNAYNGNAGPSSSISKGRHDAARPDLARGHGLLDKSLKPKDLLGIPWRVAFALQADGWYLRSDIIWHKPNPMPESVTDRPTKAHEYVFLLAKSERYHYDADAVKEAAVSDHPSGNGFKRDARLSYSGRGSDEQWTNVGGTRNRRSVWTVATEPFPGAHFAVMPPPLASMCIKAGCPKGGVVFDPFGGSGTTALVATGIGRRAIVCDLSRDYLAIAKRRVDRPHSRLRATTSASTPLFP